MVLVHGWAGNRTYWAHQIDYLAERYRVIAIDLGGHGESGLGRVEWNLAAFGDDVVAVVDEIGADRVAPREVALGSLPYARDRQSAILAALAHIAAPIVAINPGTAPTDVASLRRHGVEPILVEGVGHFAMIEAPDRFNALLGAALASFCAPA